MSFLFFIFVVILFGAGSNSLSLSLNFSWSLHLRRRLHHSEFLKLVLNFRIHIDLHLFHLQSFKIFSVIEILFIPELLLDLNGLLCLLSLLDIFLSFLKLSSRLQELVIAPVIPLQLLLLLEVYGLLLFYSFDSVVFLSEALLKVVSWVMRTRSRLFFSFHFQKQLIILILFDCFLISLFLVFLHSFSCCSCVRFIPT